MAQEPKHRSKSLLCIVALLVTASGGLVGYHYWKQQSAATHDDALNPLGFANISSSVNYVGDDACADCHPTIAANYARSAMARSWRRPQHATRIEDFSTGQEIIDSQSGYHYRTDTEGEHVVQREFRTDENGHEIHSQVREVAYVLGSGAKGRSYVSESNGHLTIMPIAWYSAPAKWDLNPGYRSSNQRFSRPVVPECIMCHNSYPLHRTGTDNQYRQPMPEGIGCERCHGAGELHVNAQQGTGPAGTSCEVERTIVNPAKLPAQLQQDVCYQCHLSTQGGVVFMNGKNPFDFRPGQPLSAFRADFELAGVAGERFSAISHGTRIARSLCFTASQGKVTCIVCHDPHLPTRDVSPGFFNSRCLTCHAIQSCSRSPETADSPLSSAAHSTNDCVTCHMPKQTHTDIEHTVTTDHWIRRRPDAMIASQESDTVRGNETVPLEDFFRVAGTGDQGIAHVRYGLAKMMPQYTKRGIRLLREALQQEPESTRWQYWLGFALRSDGNLQEARGLLEQALRTGSNAVGLSESERLGLHLNAAQLYLQLGLPNRALEVCDRLLGTDPDCLACHELAVRAQAQLGNPEAVLRRVRAGLELDPTAHYLWGMLGLGQFAFESDLTGSLASLKRALELEPMESTTYLILAEVHEAIGEPDQVEAILRQAIAVDPEAIPSHLALAKFFIGQRRAREAIVRLQHVLSKSPGNAEALQLMRAAKE